MYQHFLKVLNHKWYVLLAGLKTKAPLWRLLIHDWSKLTPTEYMGYYKKFQKQDDSEFAAAWLHHQNTNPHHWEYWISRSGPNAGKPMDMPMWAVREMVADWMGAGKAYNGVWPDLLDWKWLKVNNLTMNITPNTRRRVFEVIGEVIHRNDPAYCQVFCSCGTDLTLLHSEMKDTDLVRYTCYCGEKSSWLFDAPTPVKILEK